MSASGARLGTADKLPSPERVRATIDRLMRAGSIVADSDGSTHDVRAVSISPGEGEALSRWVLREHATRTIEIGLAYGLSTLYICDGLLRSGRPDARHLALDPFQSTRFANCGLQALREAGVTSLVEHHAAISQIALPAFLEQGRHFDLAFVDGNHRFDFVFLDLFFLGRLLPRGCVVLLDDYDLPGIHRAVSFCLTNLGWRIEETSPPDDDHHWVVLRTATTEDTRDFRHFVDF
jgi:predicted O-methyltransferase YrrM